jgi:hypothetical protein
MLAEFLLARHPYFHMLKDQIEQGVLPQIPSRLALHSTLPTNQTTVMPSLRYYQHLSPPLIFLASGEIENNVMLMIPNQRDLHHPNTENSLLHAKLRISTLVLLVKPNF